MACRHSLLMLPGMSRAVDTAVPGTEEFKRYHAAAVIIRSHVLQVRTHAIINNNSLRRTYPRSTCSNCCLRALKD